MCRLLAVLSLLWILPTTTWAERLPMRLYTTEDGLWSGFINYMMRDSHGFLWFCTRDGLSRFDGYRFINYRIGSGLSSQNFTYMFETRGGIFWIILNDKSLYRYDPRPASSSGQPRHANQANVDGRVLLPAELVSSDSLAIKFEDHKGNLWAAGAGLFQVEERAGHVSFREISLNLPQEWKPSFVVNAVAEGDDESLWLGTSHGLLRRLPDGRVAQYYVNGRPSPEDIRRLLADRDGRIWALYIGGDYVLKPESLSSLKGLSAFGSRRLNARPQDSEKSLPTSAGDAIVLAHVEAGDICEQSNGQIWLTDETRLVLFDGRQFHSYVDSSVNARGAFRGLIEDLDGDLWIATTVGGVLRFSVKGLTSYGPTDGLGAGDIASIHEDRAGRLNLVSAGWLISQGDGRTFRSVHANIPDARNLWTSPLGFLDHTGQWWLLTRRGLYRFPIARRLEDLARATPRLYTDLDGLPGQWVYSMFEDSRGDLWISVRGTEQPLAGLARWRRADEGFHKFGEADGLPPLKSAASFAEDRSGTLWFGFYDGGLARYTAGRFTSFTVADGLPEGFITGLHVDRRGRLWLTSNSGGLARVDNPSAEHPHFAHYTTREGLSSNNARTMTEDLAGDMYIGTVRGLDRLTAETDKITHYGLADGLAGSFVTTAFRDRRGTLWFGTFSGLSRLDPQPVPAPAAPPIRIEGLRIAGVKQPISEFGLPAISGLRLSAAQGNLQIDFSSLSMARAAVLRYQYKLQGVEEEWSAPTDQRTVHYANLAPGTYSFLVRAVDPSGLTSVQPASVGFRIWPPIWQRRWFLGLAALAVGCAATLLYRYRVAQLLELERVRTHIATDLHDDIGSSLSQIAVLSEVVRREVGGTATVSQPLSTIADTSRELVDSMSDIVWAINPQRDNLGDLAHRMRRFASDVLTAHNIELRFNERETEHPNRLDADVRRQVFLIFKESTHNIVRHAECSSAEIGLHMEKHVLRLTVEDNGKGFDTAQACHGHGLSSMRQRAKVLGAMLEINSCNGGGTTVSLRVPLTRHALLS